MGDRQVCKTCGAFFLIRVSGQAYCCTDCSPKSRIKPKRPTPNMSVDLPGGGVWVFSKGVKLDRREGLKRCRRYKNETEFQDHLESEFRSNNINYRREFSVPNTKNRVDFYANGFGIEAKMACSSSDIQRLIGQLTINLLVGGIKTIAVIPDDTKLPEGAVNMISSAGFEVVRESIIVSHLIEGRRL